MDHFLLAKCGDTSNLILDVIVLLEIHWPQRNLHRVTTKLMGDYLGGLVTLVEKEASIRHL
jgi:hypothetical protein